MYLSAAIACFSKKSNYLTQQKFITQYAVGNFSARSGDRTSLARLSSLTQYNLVQLCVLEYFELICDRASNRQGLLLCNGSVGLVLSQN